MKRRHYIFLLLATALALFMTGCDKWDCNGDLDGMWQLTEWRDANGNVKADKQAMIFYSFQLQMVSFRKSGKQTVSRALLEVGEEKLRIYSPFEYVGGGHDRELPMSVLADFGVPDDGIFLTEVLTEGSMVLRTNANEVLTFRKY